MHVEKEDVIIMISRRTVEALTRSLLRILSSVFILGAVEVMLLALSM